MRSITRWGCAVGLLAALASTAGCSKNPEAAKKDFVARGDRYVEQKKLAEAVIEYRNAVNLDARYGEARYKLGQTYERLGDPQKAFGEFVRAADLLPDRDDVQIKAATYLLLAGRFDDAKRISGVLLRKNPRNLDAKIVEANALAGLKDLPAAMAELESAIEIDPKQVGTYLNLAAYQVAGGNPKQAEAVLLDAIAQQPGSVDARLGLANIYWSSGDLAKTETVLKEALAIQPQHELANRALAGFYLRTGRVKEAEVPLRIVADSSKGIAARLALAQYYLGMGRRADAVPILKAVEKEPDGRVPASLMLARVEYVDGQKAQAHSRLDEMAVREPNNTQVLMLKAQLLAADGRLNEAIARARSAATANPKLAAAQHLLGLLYLEQRDSTQALNAFNESLKLDPTAMASALQVAKIQLRSGRADLALPLVQDVVGKQPSNLDARLTLVRALVARGNLDRAESESATLVAQVPRSADVQVLAGTVALAKKNLAAASAAFKRAIEMDNSSVPALGGLVALDFANRKPADAQARVAARLATDGRNPAVIELAAGVYAAAGNAGKAEELWRQLIDVQPSNLGAYAALGSLFARQNRLDDARRQFEQYADKDPNSVGAHTAVGMILQMQNRQAEAQKQYERALEIDKNAAVAANNLAWMYAEQNANLDVALQLAQTAKTQLPDRPEIDDTLGWIYYKKGLAALAVSSFEQSVAKDPGNAGYLYHLGLAHLKSGNIQKARESLQKALKANPNFPEAAEARKALSGLS